MNTTAFLRSLLAFVVAAVLAGAALAGQNCEPRRPTLDTMRRDLALAASVATQLDEMAQRDGSRVLLIARAGQDLSKYGLRYSHLGIAYRDDAALGGRGAWRVVHKLNQCGSSRSELYRQGLAEFFGDGLYLHEAGVVALKPELAARVIDGLKDDALLATLHEPRYNMLAYPWSGPYQQSNQWAIETLAHAGRSFRGQSRHCARLVAAPGLPADHAADRLRCTRLGARVGHRPHRLRRPPFRAAHGRSDRDRHGGLGIRLDGARRARRGAVAPAHAAAIRQSARHRARPGANANGLESANPP